MFRKLVLTFGIATIALSATACNTVKGLGRDIESAGQAGEDVINDS